MHGFGPVEREPDEPVFHAAWEGRIWGMSRACVAQGLFNQDEARHGIERMDPVAYLRSSYYERWLARTLRLLEEKSVLAPGELAARLARLRAGETPPAPAADPAGRERLLAALGARPVYRRPGPAPRYRPGDRVRTGGDHPVGHTRLPRYARDRAGVVHLVHGVYVFPDTNAHGAGEQPQALYNVRFEGETLWGPQAAARAAVHLDLWESYLRPA
jgi:nitrile hydratase